MFDKYNNVATLVRDNAVMGLLIYICIIQTANFVIGLMRDVRVVKAMKLATELSTMVKKAFGQLVPNVDPNQKDIFTKN